MRLVPSPGGLTHVAQRVREAAGGAYAYRTLFDLGPDGWVVTDPVGTIALANRVAGSLLTCPPLALVGRPLAEFVASVHRRHLVARLAKLPFGNAGRGEEWRVRLQPSDGRSFEAAVAVASVAEAAPDGGNLLLWTLRDVSAHRRVEKRLRESRGRYRSLYRQLLAHQGQAGSLATRCLRAREDEARRIAHELHDEAGQVAATIHLALQELEEELPPRYWPRLRRVRGLVVASADRLRTLSHELRPTILDDLGLTRALGFLAEVFSARTGVPVEVTGDVGEPRLDPLMETVLYRIIQEALANVARHARARSVRVNFRGRSGRLCCSIADDGIGFDPGRAAHGEGGLGLLGIRERVEALGGRLEIRSAPGHGTELVARLSSRGRQ